MLLLIVLITYENFKFGQGSRIRTLLTYSYTIKKQYLIKISLIVKVCYKSLHINIGNKGDCFAHILCLYFGNWSIACKINIGIKFVEHPPGNELPFLFCFRDTFLCFLYFSVIFSESCNNIWTTFYVYSFQKLLSSMCSHISFDSQTEITNLILLHKTLVGHFDQIMLMDSFWFLSESTLTWSLPRNTIGKHYDRSYMC